MRWFIFVRSLDNHPEWRFYEKTRSAQEIKQLPCFNPMPDVVPKSRYKYIDSEDFALSPCLAGGGSGDPVHGKIVQVESE